jgi:hypothetical protein
MEVRDGIVWNGATPFAALEPSSAIADAVTVRPLVPSVLGRAEASALVHALTTARVAALEVYDELVRFEARAVGWTGPLRAPLVAPATAATVLLDPVLEIEQLLPGATVHRRGFNRHALSLRAVAPDGLRFKLKAPERADVMPEMLAAALDTAFAIRRRFGRMASGVQGITVDDGAGGMDDHRTSGSAWTSSGTFFLDTMLADADAMDAQRQRSGGRSGISATPSRPWFAIDGVVAHEYWHNLDAEVASSPATYLELNRGLGAELGVDTYEHALRGREPSAPPEWQRAFQRILTEVSPYATTNWRESTAELFKLWWCRPVSGPPAPLVARFGVLLEQFYPPR